jgi:DNA-binding NarL/FixJ family response regulator
MPLRVLVAEDQVLLRQGLVSLLGSAGLEVVGEAGDATEVMGLVRSTLPDVVLIDIQMPPEHTDDGLRAAMEIRAALPRVGVIVLSQFLEERYVLDLVGSDARGVGYLLKDRIGDVATLVDAIARVADGGSALDPEVVARMVGRRRKDDPLDALTPRERQVLALMAQGKSNHGIAGELAISVAAAEKHATNIFGKLGVGSEQSEHRRVMAVLTQLRAS